MLFTNRLITQIVEVLLLVDLMVTNPWRMTRETRWSRWASIGLASVVILTNLGSLALLVSNLAGNVASGSHLFGSFRRTTSRLVTYHAGRDWLPFRLTWGSDPA
jgi:hypothetical protein